MDPFSLAVAGLGLALSLYQERRHRRADRVELRLRGSVVSEDAGIVVVNSGRRPVIMKSVHAEMTDGVNQEVIYSPGAVLPRTLNEHEDHELHLGSKWFDGSGRQATGFYIVDSLGKRWRLPRKEFRSLQRAAREAVKQGRDEKIAADLQAGRKFIEDLQAERKKADLKGRKP